ncbi:hypothetical protein EA794_07390 [Lactococcus petauri]|uniref:hypothetical protein n=1 Tax=Lactococcus petauri TaxID=1940789 RepID=UPI0013FE469D|nr:hypothetical protein [Lactococcus petauri]NHI75795.1 hypothetical protein [Lactococcus petauri]
MKRKVMAIDYKSQELLKEFDSLKSASEYYGVTTNKIKKQCEENGSLINYVDFYFVDEYSETNNYDIEVIRRGARIQNNIFGTKITGSSK